MLVTLVIRQILRDNSLKMKALRIAYKNHVCISDGISQLQPVLSRTKNRLNKRVISSLPFKRFLF
ncbi:hypothetical protein QFZ51_003780 [Chitinophaga sp. W3I9]